MGKNTVIWVPGHRNKNSQEKEKYRWEKQEEEVWKQHSTSGASLCLYISYLKTQLYCKHANYSKKLKTVSVGRQGKDWEKIWGQW